MPGVFLFLRQESSNLKSCCYQMSCILCGPLKHVSNLHEFSLSRFWPLWLEARMENWVSQASSFLFSFSSIFSPLPFIFLPKIWFAHILNLASSLVISASLLFWFCPKSSVTGLLKVCHVCHAGMAQTSTEKHDSVTSSASNSFMSCVIKIYSFLFWCLAGCQQDLSILAFNH